MKMIERPLFKRSLILLFVGGVILFAYSLLKVHTGPEELDASPTATMTVSAPSLSDKNNLISPSQSQPPLEQAGTSNYGTWVSISTASTSLFHVERDKVIFNDRVVEFADPKTFEVFRTSAGDHPHARDAQHVYDGEAYMTEGADAPTFTPIGPGYAKDYRQAYWYTWQDGGIIDQVDLPTFSWDQNLGVFAKDKNHVYYLDRIVAGAMPSSFRVFPRSWYARDGQQVFLRYGYGSYTNTTEVRHPETFAPFYYSGSEYSSIYGADQEAVYCYGRVMKVADKATFQADGQTWGHDNVQKYFDCEPASTVN